MKKTTIIILICSAIVLGMICGIIFSILDDKKLEEAQINEDWHKENDDFCLYVLTPEMTGIYSIFEWLMIVINVLIEQYFVYFQKEMEKPLVSVFKKIS